MKFFYLGPKERQYWNDLTITGAAVETIVCSLVDTLEKIMQTVQLNRENEDVDFLKSELENTKRVIREIQNSVGFNWVQDADLENFIIE